MPPPFHDPERLYMSITQNPQFDRVKKFNETFGHEVRDVPSMEHSDIPLRFNIMMEEVQEIKSALDRFYEGILTEEEALVEIADGIADTLVTLYGFSQAVGIPVTEAADIVFDSNESKLGADGKPVYFTEGEKKGKIAKGPNYWSPEEKLVALIREKRANA